MKKALAVAVCASAFAVGCGSSTDKASDETTVVTKVETVYVTPTSEAAAEPVLVPMPDVVCMNLQDAQNKIQAAGVFFSRSTDDTGQGRAQIMDRNWTVVRQEPAPGELIGEGDANLYVVKEGEPGDC
jgi:beta-lactam-binding protein with PASTA domain